MQLSNSNHENIYAALKETGKKITDLKAFHIPVILNTIKEYEEAGADESFIRQQRVNLDKVYARLEELEAKAGRLLKRL